MYHYYNMFCPRFTTWSDDFKESLVKCVKSNDSCEYPSLKGWQPSIRNLHTFEDLLKAACTVFPNSTKGVLRLYLTESVLQTIAMAIPLADSNKWKLVVSMISIHQFSASSRRSFGTTFGEVFYRTPTGPSDGAMRWFAKQQFCHDIEHVWELWNKDKHLQKFMLRFAKILPSDYADIVPDKFVNEYEKANDYAARMGLEKKIAGSCHIDGDSTEQEVATALKSLASSYVTSSPECRLQAIRSIVSSLRSDKFPSEYMTVLYKHMSKMAKGQYQLCGVDKQAEASPECQLHLQWLAGVANAGGKNWSQLCKHGANIMNRKKKDIPKSMMRLIELMPDADEFGMLYRRVSVSEESVIKGSLSRLFADRGKQ